MKQNKVIEDPKKSIRSGIHLSDEAVLPEVRRRFPRERQVRVIIGIRDGLSPNDGRKYLNSMGIKVHRGGTENYLFATITEEQANILDKENEKLCSKCVVNRVWLDKTIKAMVEKSQATINAQAARNLFGKGGKDIHWAVMDTGIFVDHDWLNDLPPSIVPALE